MNLLGLSSSLFTVPKTAPAAKTRFLHIPGTQGLTALPSSFASLFKTPLGRALTLAAVREPFRLHSRSVNSDDADEALEPFLAARLNPEIARILGSALVHGIYAGDSRVLSVRAAFSPLWSIAQEGNGSIGRGLARRTVRKLVGATAKVEEKQYDIGEEVAEKLKDASVYSFHDGMSTLVRALEADLERRWNVKIVKGEGAAAITRNADSDLRVRINCSSSSKIALIMWAMSYTGHHNGGKRDTSVTSRLCDAASCTRRSPEAFLAPSSPPSLRQPAVLGNSCQPCVSSYTYRRADPPRGLRIPRPTPQGRSGRGARDCLRFVLSSCSRRVPDARRAALHEDDYDATSRPCFTLVYLVSLTRSHIVIPHAPPRRQTAASQTCAFPRARQS